MDTPPSLRYITRLVLQNFRSHVALSWQLDGRPVVITGANGAGKTNILEAISLFTPGRGLRRANGSALPYRGKIIPNAPALGTSASAARSVGEFEGEHPQSNNTKGDGLWVASLHVEGSFAPVQLGTGLQRSATGQKQRVVHIDGTEEASIAACGQHISILWLTPDMDRLLRDTPSERRKFLDRLALNLHPNHAANVLKYEKLLQSRMRLLTQTRYDATWLSAIEQELAEYAVLVSTTRLHIIDLLRAHLAQTRDEHAPLPWADVWLEGAYEKQLATLEPHDFVPHTQAMFAYNRARDAQQGRTLMGPHVADVCVLHGAKNCLAVDASTGEQKALLLRLILAHAHILAQQQGFNPIILLDEVCAHLDPARRGAVLAALQQLGVQAWLTGTDVDAYRAWGSVAQFVEI